METDLSIVVVSYAFPPSGDVGARRVAAFCKYLPEFGIDPIVLTIDESSCEKLDKTLPLPTDLRVERVRPRMTFLQRYHRHSEKSAAAQENGPLNASNSKRSDPRALLSVRQHLVASLSFPDIHNGWRRPALKAAARAVDRFHPSAILSSGPPWTSHAVAYTIARRYHIPWIADFRDQWASDPWRRYDFSGEGPPPWRSKLDLWTEYRWVHNASLVVCATNRQREALLRAHPRALPDRVITIPNGCEPNGESSSCATQPTSGPRVLLHLGGLYGGRRIDGFCKALEFLVQERTISSTGTRVNLVGTTEPEIERCARESAPEVFRTGMVAVCPHVDRNQVREYLRQASVLLIFQGDHPTAIPAKFYEYLRTGKPILALTGDSALKDIILRTGSGFVADPDDQSTICSAIEQALRAEIRPAEEVARVVKEFDLRNLTATLAANIRDICAAAYRRANA